MQPNPSLDRVTAIVVTHNSAHCIAPLAVGLSTFAQVVVVDNASSDDTAACVRRDLPQARLILSDKNLGFGAANNLAAAQASTPWLLLINPDCTLDADAVLALLQCADANPDASVIAPQLLARDASLDVSYRWRSNAWASRGPQADGPVCVGFVSGACMMVRQTAYQSVGGFDEAFFLYYEDDDLCLRLQRDAGPLIVEPRSQVLHVSRGSVGGRARWRSEYTRGFHHVQSKFLFAHKHLGGFPSAARRNRYMVLGVAEAMARCLVLDTRRAARAWGRAMGVWRWSAVAALAKANTTSDMNKVTP
jgi:N-acetylglucosaminyl-diphospho-decaprenol L-rhamnosyltransferase